MFILFASRVVPLGCHSSIPSFSLRAREHAHIVHTVGFLALFKNGWSEHQPVITVFLTAWCVGYSLLKVLLITFAVLCCAVGLSSTSTASSLLVPNTTLTCFSDIYYSSHFF